MPKRLGGVAIEILSATERSGISDNSWKMQTTPAAVAADGLANWRARPSSEIDAAVRLNDAGDDLDQRRLAGAVLAEDGMDGPARTRENRRSRARARRRSVWIFRREQENRLAARPP